MTPLHYTAVYGRPDAAKLLIQNGVPLDIAIYRRKWEPSEHEGRRMFKPLDGQEGPGNPAGGLTPLHYAALVGNHEMVQFFLDYGGDPNSRSYYRETPLHLTLRRSVQGIEYVDYWTDTTFRIEYVLDLIDDEDNKDKAYKNITKERMSIFDTLLSDPKLMSIYKTLKELQHYTVYSTGLEKVMFLFPS